MWTLTQDYDADGTNEVGSGMMIRNILLKRHFSKGDNVDGVVSGGMLTVETDGGTDTDGNAYSGKSVFTIPTTFLTVPVTTAVTPNATQPPINNALAIVAILVGGYFLVSLAIPFLKHD
jgi:hypothetical protein